MTDLPQRNSNPAPDSDDDWFDDEPSSRGNAVDDSSVDSDWSAIGGTTEFSIDLSDEESASTSATSEVEPPTPDVDATVVDAPVTNEAPATNDAPAPDSPIAAEETAPADFLGQAIASTETSREIIRFDLETFLNEPGWKESILQWLAGIAPRDRPTSAKAACRMMQREIARLDRLLSRQVNKIIHDPQFQRLEASWRGIRFLVGQLEGKQNIRLRLLNLSFRELVRDLDRAVEFDQSQFFKRIYEDEFGTAGGEPFGLLIGDYEFQHRISSQHPTDDVRVLEQISHVAAAAFAPFITSASPEFFGVDSYADLQRPINLARIFEQTEYLKWRSFRESEDARFVGLVLPRILMRPPYRDGDGLVHRFRFQEEGEGPASANPNETRDRLRESCVWGNAAYAFAAVVMRAFSETRWFADIRGVQRGDFNGGVVTELEPDSYQTDREGIALKPSVDFLISDEREKELSELGFIALCPCKDTPYSVFYGNASCQKPKGYDSPAATANTKLSSMLQYMLCVSRFSHYIKIMGRDKIGSLSEAEECERFLHRWLHRYVTEDDNASLASKAKYPLREARVEVKEMPGKPGNYLCVTHLRPHFQLDDLVASVRLFTELAPPSAG